MLIKPDSVDRAKALVRKLDEESPPKSATRVVDGWLVVSDSERMIDRVLKGSTGRALANDATFKDAVSELPDDALAKAYVNGPRLAEVIGRYLDQATQTAASTPFGLDKLDWIAASLEAKEDGVRFDAGVKSADDGGVFGTAAPYASKLISGVPAGALAFLTFRGGTDQGGAIGELERNPQFGQALEQLERMLGVQLDDVLALFEHEVALYVRRGPGLPEFSLALEQPDTAKALSTLDRLAARISVLTHTKMSEEDQGGVGVKSLSLGGVTVHWAGFGGRVLVTTAPTGIGDYRAAGDKLSDDPAFKHALAAAGAPDKAGGLVYVNLHDGVQLIENYLGISGGGLPADVSANLKPLQSFVAYSTESGDLTKFAAFLEIT